ncbi:MAG: SMP-30/gluconolactonase/LRE family protein [Leptospira sp.]|nr:SMP-30/gluconolactonase/LRE family protein [Leptospira sp.]
MRTLYALIFFICFLPLFVSCVTISPVAYDPPPAPPMEGVLEPNDKLKQAELVARGKIFGPEGLDISKEGDLYVASGDGNIYKIPKDSDDPEFFVRTGGRPLGIQFDASGNLIVCDAYFGLLAVSKDKEISVLTTGSDGLEFRFTDDLDIAQDGKIYFSDASYKYKQPEYLYDLLESKPHGRLLVYDPKAKTTKTLLKDLYFANGVALSKNEDFVLVNETYRYRITKYWLKGKNAGKKEIFLGNLPGFPDNITRSKSGDFYLALFTVRNERMDNMHPSPFRKKMVSLLPKMFWPKPQPYGFVLKISDQGEILESYQDPTGMHLKEITHAQEQDGFLYLGSLYNDRVGKFKLESGGETKND